jgi:MFS family permease
MTTSRLVTPAFVALTSSELAYFTAIGMLLPVVPLYVTDRLGAPAAAVGLAVGAFALTALLLRPLAGRLADRWGRKRLLVAGAALFTLVLIAHVAITDLTHLVGLRVALGAAEAAYFVGATAVLTDLAPPERLGAAMSYSSLGLYLGLAAGPLLGEALVEWAGYDAAWLGAAALGLVALLLTRLVPATASGGAEPDAPGLDRGALGPGLAFVAGLAGIGGFLGFVALYSRDVGLDGAGTVLLVYGSVVVVGRIALAGTTDRLPAARLSALALLLCGAGLVTMGTVRTTTGLFAGTVVLAVGGTLLTPAFFRLLMSRLPAHRRGAGAATFSIAVDLGLGGGPVLFGTLVQVGSIPAAMVIMGGVAVATAAAGRLLARGRRDRPLDATPT